MNKELLYTLPAWAHDKDSITEIFANHPEVKFVSLAGVDIYGHDTDEKIPIAELLSDPEQFLSNGVQTDGSAVLLPLIADISNGSVKLVPDADVNWYVDYNRESLKTDAPIGTLRIPAYLVHNETHEVGSRAILRDSLKSFKEGLMNLLNSNPYIFEYLPISSPEEIEEIVLTSATELEFYVKTPNEDADKERLHAAQEMKEQYWKRTVGTVRTALEHTLIDLDKYGFGVEMGHKEVGGVQAVFMQGGDYDHIMEQLEIDWRFQEPMQAADNDYQVRYFVKDTFRSFGLDATFMAKPVEGAAGSGKHTHIGVFARLKNGELVNLFAPKDPDKEYLSPIGFGAVMGILKNYEVVNPIANCTTDALNRLKPGYEAPVCTVTSLGQTPQLPSRNRTVLLGLIRDPKHTKATRFELRSPNPKSNTYLVIAACLMTMLDGIKAALNSGKTSARLLDSISKGYGDPDFYLEAKRVYRCEGNIFEDYTAEEREMLFGKMPQTVWDSIRGFDIYPEKTAVLLEGGFDELDLESFKAAAIEQWTSELHAKNIPDYREAVRACAGKLHTEENSLDDERYEAVLLLAKEIIKDTREKPSLLTRLTRALEDKDYESAANLQLEVKEKVAALEAIHSEYKKNIF